MPPTFIQGVEFRGHMPPIGALSCLVRDIFAVVIVFLTVDGEQELPVHRQLINSPVVITALTVVCMLWASGWRDIAVWRRHSPAGDHGQLVSSGS